jgi:coenzyme F420-reducing hydrogenase delta subunit
MRLEYPTNVRIVRVPCTGKVDLLHIMRAFEKGADGVMVIGCLEGDCHFNKGNFRARKRVEAAQKLLDTVQIGGERAQMFNLSSGEGPLFAQFAREMKDKITALGPNPLREKSKDKKAA